MRARLLVKHWLANGFDMRRLSIAYVPPCARGRNQAAHAEQTRTSESVTGSKSWLSPTRREALRGLAPFLTYSPTGGNSGSITRDRFIDQLASLWGWLKERPHDRERQPQESRCKVLN